MEPIRVGDYMSIPLRAGQDPAYQYFQMYLPLVGLAAAIVHACFFGRSSGVILTTVVLSLLTGLGVTVGFHRLYTHRSFEAVWPVRMLLAVFGSMAAQGTVFTWIATHRQHHQFSDHDGDPHSPNTTKSWWLGRLFHAQAGWMISDHMTQERLRYIPDLIADPMVCRIQRLHLLWVALGLALPALVCYAISGTWQAALGGLLWGGFARIAITGHLSNSVNSLCHFWGARPFDSHDRSRNNGFLAMLTLGEGWHNNHHAFPTSARHGLHWWQADTSYQVIKMLRRLGLAWNLKTPTPEQIVAKQHVGRARDAVATDAVSESTEQAVVR